MKKIKLVFKDKELILTLRNNKTANAIFNASPFKSNVKKWGEEIFFNIPLKVDLEKDAKSIIEFGEVAFWTEGSAIAIGYGPTPISKKDEIKLVAPCNIWADSKFDKEFFRDDHEEDKVEVIRI